MSRKLSTIDPSKKWNGPVREYDLIKEFVIAVVVVGFLALTLAAVFSSPDEKALTMQSWAKAAPADFVQTTAGELAGTTTSASYGPPYNKNGEGQNIGPINLSKAAGVRIPIDPAQSFVIEPLKSQSDSKIQSAVSMWISASAQVQAKWASAYSDALTKDGKSLSLKDPSGKYGPVPTLVTSLYGMASTGALDGALTTSDSTLPTNFTKPLLFLADSGSYFPDKAAAQHLSGDQWGVMNETGSWPGQSWLWLYSLWYQIEPFKSSGNADILVMSLMGVLSLGLLLLPVLPVISRIPYWIPVHRLIWRNWYRRSGE